MMRVMSVNLYNKAHGAELNVSLGAIFKNWQFFKNKASNGKTAAIVKADAYGLGAPTIAQYLEEKSVSDFFVAHLSEAITLREYGICGNIYTLNGLNFCHEIYDDILKSYMQYNIIPVINSLEELKLFYDFLKRYNKTYSAVLHVDTGMNRLGFSAEEWKQISPNHPYFSFIEVKCIMSHLACADEAKNPYNAKQQELFCEYTKLWKNTPLSLANSAGIFLGENYQAHLNRPGIGLYGGYIPSEKPSSLPLPVVELLAPIVQIRHLQKGEYVGYDCSWVAQKESQIATISLGYADGIFRSISGKAYGIIAGYKVPIIGRVSMDSINLDITDIPNEFKKTQQKVEILGKNITINLMASWANTIPYEILTNLGSRFHKNYIREIL